MTEFSGVDTVTLDARTVNIQQASKAGTSAEAQIRAIEKEKNDKYKDYYKKFAPYVVSLSGAVSKTGFGIVKHITAQAATMAAPRPGWVKNNWAIDIGCVSRP